MNNEPGIDNLSELLKIIHSIAPSYRKIFLANLKLLLNSSVEYEQAKSCLCWHFYQQQDDYEIDLAIRAEWIDEWLEAGVLKENIIFLICLKFGRDARESDRYKGVIELAREVKPIYYQMLSKEPIPCPADYSLPDIFVIADAFPKLVLNCLNHGYVFNDWGVRERLNFLALYQVNPSDESVLEIFADIESSLDQSH